MIILGRSLRTQFLLILATLLLIPVLVMLYDIFFASKSDEIMLRDRETRLRSLIMTIVVPGIQDRLQKQHPASDDWANVNSSDIKAFQQAFNEVTAPLVPSFPGVRIGLYLPESDQIFVQGFLHQYRKLSPEESREREKRIMEEAKTGLLAVVASQQPLARLTSSLNDETYEYLAPVFYNNKLVAVAWADERLHPIFAQSRSFRLLTRYISLSIFFLAALGALIFVHNLTAGVSRIKEGLMLMKTDLNKLLPEMPGEAGEIARAINAMAISLAQKEQLEEELRRSERLASLGRLVTGVAHELRNPIGVVKATVQVMEAEFKNQPEIQEFTSVIKEQVDRQNRVIQELLDFGRPHTPVVQPLCINDILHRVLTFTSPMLRQHSIELVTELAEDMPKLSADPERMKQVFVNMILNAIQAMPRGGKLLIQSGLDGEQAFISFTDSGEGIAPENLAHIFEPFYTTKSQGTGLGLSISHQIVTSHGGRIHVSSRPGEGSTFTIVLPLSGMSEEKEGAYI